VRFVDRCAVTVSNVLLLLRRVLLSALAVLPSRTSAFSRVALCMEPLITHDLGAAGTGTGVWHHNSTQGQQAAQQLRQAQGPPRHPSALPPHPSVCWTHFQPAWGCLGVAGARPGAVASSTMTGAGVTSLAGGASAAGTGLGSGSSVPMVDGGGWWGLSELAKPTESRCGDERGRADCCCSQPYGS